MTRAEPGRAVLLRETATGAEMPVGRFDPALPGPENRMRPLPQGFLALGVPALGRCAQAAGEWVMIDEVGYLETACPPYTAALTALMDQKRLLAAVRKQDLPFLQALLRRADVFAVDLDAPFGRSGCVIMASGLGVRFGGNKLLAPFGGQPLILRALAATAGLFARRVLVTRAPAVAQLAREQGVQAVLHSLPQRSDTVRLGLRALGVGRGWTACCSAPATSRCCGRKRSPRCCCARRRTRTASGARRTAAAPARRCGSRLRFCRSSPRCRPAAAARRSLGPTRTVCAALRSPTPPNWPT